MLMAARQPSAVRAGLRLVVEGLRRRGETPPPASAPKRRVAVEREGIQVAPARLRDFLAATRGEAIGTGPTDSLPPTVASLWETALALELLAVAGVGLPRGGLIHLESEVIPIRPMYASDRLRARVELDRVEAHRKGTVLVLRGRCWNGAGQLSQESVVKLLARSSTPSLEAGPRTREDDGSRETGWRTLTEFRAAANLGRRYARVSGDYNPIHLWPWSARLLGFRRPILHGACIEAMVAHAIIAEVGGGPSALRRLQISFRAPLLLPADVRLQIADSDHGGHRFRLLSPDQPDRRAYAEGCYLGEV
jgi:acyl dehydratase